MIRIAITILAIVAGLAGQQSYSSYQISGNDIDVSVVTKPKCITKDGQAIDGIISKGTVCVTPESIKIAKKSSEQIKPFKLFYLSISSDTASNFKCDGRQYCSQMTSCAEARFFLNNCPNTKMDGDGDGIPCEKQWCN